MTHHLLITENPFIANEFRKLAAVAGTELVVSENPNDSEIAQGCKIYLDHEMSQKIPFSLSPVSKSPRHVPIIVVLAGAASSRTWELAQQVNASHVALLPESRDWLLEQMQLQPAKLGQVLSFIPAVAGAGCSTLVGALAANWAKQGKTVAVVDCDASSVGLDVAFGVDQTTGLRWSEFMKPEFDPEPVALHRNLPSCEGVSLLSNDVPNNGELGKRLSQVVTLLREVSDILILDHKPHPDAPLAELQTQAINAIVMPNTLRACANAHAFLKDRSNENRVLVVRELPNTDLSPLAIAQSLDTPLWGVIPTDPRIVEFVEQGQILSGVNTTKYNRAVFSLANRLVDDDSVSIAS